MRCLRVYGWGLRRGPLFRRGERDYLVVARRRRNKSRAASPATKAVGVDVKGAASRDHMARVHVDDETWAAFKQAAGPIPISEVLGQLVAKHVDCHVVRRIRDPNVADRQLVDALEQARELHADVESIVARLEQRLDHRSGPTYTAADRV